MEKQKKKKWSEAQKRYARSEKGKLARKKYQSSEKGRASHIAYLAKRKTRLAEAKVVKEISPVEIKFEASKIEAGAVKK